MKVPFEYAVLWFTPHMTDPDTEPIPVGLIAVGPLTTSSSFYFVGAARRPIGTAVDANGTPVDLPTKLDKLVSIALEEVGPGRMLEWFQANLRHSLAFSPTVASSIELPFADPAEVMQRLVPLFKEKVVSPMSEEPAPSLTAFRFDVAQTAPGA